MKGSDEKLKVLVVDDNEDGALMLTMIIEHMGHRVMSAHNGEAALEMGEIFQPHLVLMDINMPKLNGFKTCEIMRNSDWAKQTHIAALTGLSQQEDRQQASVVGFDEFLLKPVGRDTLKQVIEKCLHNS